MILLSFNSDKEGIVKTRSRKFGKFYSGFKLLSVTEKFMK